MARMRSRVTSNVFPTSSINESQCSFCLEEYAANATARTSLDSRSQGARSAGRKFPSLGSVSEHLKNVCRQGIITSCTHAGCVKVNSITSADNQKKPYSIKLFRTIGKPSKPNVRWKGEPCPNMLLRSSKVSFVAAFSPMALGVFIARHASMRGWWRFLARGGDFAPRAERDAWPRLRFISPTN